MTLRRALRLTILTAAALAGSSAALAATIDDAEAAFAAGETVRALELYDRALDEDPADPRALMGSGLLHSWNGEHDLALERYDRLLALEPGHRRAAIERAKVLSWAGRYDEAIPAFERLLAEDPEDVPSRLALARALAWSGRLRPARRAYGEVLGRAPGNKDARVGLAYVHLWAGDLPGAIRLADGLAGDHAGDADVVELRERLASRRGPWVRVAADRVDDSDDNRLDIFRAGMGLALPLPAELEVGLARHDMRDQAGDAAIDTAEVSLVFRPSFGQRIAVRAGVDRLEDFAGERSTETIGGLAWTGGLDRRWQPFAAWNRDSLRYSPRITSNGIVIEDLTGGVRGRIATRWRLALSATRADYSDDNRRAQALATVAWEAPVGRVGLEAGYAARWVDFERDTDGGYFDPMRFTSHLLRVSLADGWGSRGARYTLEAEGGIQSFTLGGAEVDNDGVLILTGTLTLPVGRGMALELYASRGDYAAQTAAGFESRQVGLRWRLARGERRR